MLEQLGDFKDVLVYFRNSAGSVPFAALLQVLLIAGDVYRERRDLGDELGEKRDYTKRAVQHVGTALRRELCKVGHGLGCLVQFCVVLGVVLLRVQTQFCVIGNPET